MPLSIRRQARILAMQSLYEWDLAGHDPFVALERHVTLRHESARVATFAGAIVQRVVDHLTAIDTQLAEVAAERPLSQMARVEKAILRLAISEILFDNAVPARAAMNEAVELAKTFGGDNSARFVNGVLGAIYLAFTAPRAQHHNSESEAPPDGHQPALGSPEAGYR